MVRPWVPDSAQVLDIGCHQGEFLRSLGSRIGSSVGLDPLARPESRSRYKLLSEPFSAPCPFPDASFDVVVMLATLEHIPDKAPLARECYRLLRPAGRVVVTVPSPHVDYIIALLCRLRLADGMSLEEHHGFEPRQSLRLFAEHGFTLERWRPFQLGLNHLFVFKKPTRTPPGVAGARQSPEPIPARP